MKTSRLATRSTPPGPVVPQSTGDTLLRVFSLCFGLFFALALVKFGNLVLIEVWKPKPGDWITSLGASPSGEGLVSWPTNGWEWFLTSWPLVIGYWVLLGIAFFGIVVRCQKINAPLWLVFLPAVWLVWQLIAGGHSINASLTGVTLKHFAACIACFYLGLISLSRDKNLTGFCLGLLVGFVWVVACGLFQHFGGLEDARKQFYLYVYPNMQSPPAELIKRMTSTRIFSTLFYPNALAGALLLCVPVLLCFLWNLKSQFTSGARALLVAIVGLPALACLFWSGSKGGWLLMLLLGLIALLRLKFERKLKIAIVTVVLLCGIAGFAIRFSAYFKRGATSVSARFDYWRAAVQNTRDNPAFGSGPGTFAIPYRQLKKPDAEMSRLVHNDYLQQATDSGLPGFLLYLAAIASALAWSGRRVWKTGGLPFAVWLSVLGLALQSLMEFGLYIPALAWLFFALLGWLLGSLPNPVDKIKPTS